MKYTPERSDLAANTLFRPPCMHKKEDSCHMCSVSIAIRTFSAKEIRIKHLKDPELKKVKRTRS